MALREPLRLRYLIKADCKIATLTCTVAPKTIQPVARGASALPATPQKKTKEPSEKLFFDGKHEFSFLERRLRQLFSERFYVPLCPGEGASEVNKAIVATEEVVTEMLVFVKRSIRKLSGGKMSTEKTIRKLSGLGFRAKPGN